MGAFAQEPRHSTSKRENIPSFVVPPSLLHVEIEREERLSYAETSREQGQILIIIIIIIIIIISGKKRT
jgi:hypothetical protein